MRITESKFRQIVRSELLKEMDSETSSLRLISDVVSGVKVYSDLSDPTRLLFVHDEMISGLEGHLEDSEDMGIFSHSSYGGVKNILVPGLPEGHVEVRCFPEKCDVITRKVLKLIESQSSL